MTSIELSIVAPVFNGLDTIKEYVFRTEKTLKALNKSYQIILIDDGSTDGSLALMRKLQEEFPVVKIIKLTRNYGQSNAIAAGLLKANGAYIVVMDSDLQDKPEDILPLYIKIRQVDEDMIIATKERKNRSLWRNFCSYLFYIFTNLLTRLRFPSQTGVFRIMKKKCLDQLDEALQTPGTVLSFIHASGYSWKTIPLPREERNSQKSNYTFRTMWHLALCRILPYCRLSIIKQNSKFIPEFCIEEIYGEDQNE
ncbi:MAG: glycosyltransferase family 2 protein [Candidatus Stygibacter frigidus]|nr:glycosyltransferase family 2 protein [Candidatus Stygibacter frigidus]